MLFAMAVVFLILFHFSLTWFGKYFDSINRGINALLSPDHEPIIMPREMRFVEENLQTVQRTLEEQRAETELAEQKKDELILYLAHDIKTPLTSVIGYLSILDENKDMDTAQREKCVRIGLEKATRLEKLINEFFEITRFRQADITLSKSKIDLHYMLIQLVDEFTPQLQACLVEIQIHMPEDIYLYGDADYLARALQNILKNAVAYSDANSVISISSQRMGDKVKITISNIGDTISPEQQAHIFEKFYRADEARQGNTGGAGLGLAIAKNIVVLHGGTITVESENRNTTFTILLPDSNST
jgi:two-component system sensor histidine kinase VanS